MGWYDRLASGADDLAGGTDEWVGQHTDWDGAVEESSNPIQGTGRRLTGALNFAVASLPGAVENPQEQWVARGNQRTLVDTVFDYEGTWGGEKDSEDLTGPSFDPSDVGDGEGLSALGLDWRSELSQETDPTSPENNWFIKWLMNNPGQVVAVVVGVYLLSLLGPIFEMGASLTDE